jgi:hypothetical protein
MNLKFLGCPHFIWNDLSHLCLALSINTTNKLYAIANEIPLLIRILWFNHNSVAVAGADNMSYITHTSQHRAVMNTVKMMI